MIPGMAGSPGNLISLMGESPPTQPSSYEDRGLPSGWSSPSTRPYLQSHPASVSPPTSGRRPLSFQMDGRYQQPPDLPSHIAMGGPRRSSLHSHIAQSRGGPNPPLPHQAQPHFYGTPELDFDMQSQVGMRAGERGYHFGFDTLPAQGAANVVPGTGSVVVAGYEGGLDVYSVSKRGLESVATLKGLRGGVYDAKILPWSPSDSGPDIYPLIAVVLHGPVLNTVPEVHVQSEDGDTASTQSPERALRDDMSHKGNLPVEFYQTTVEVLSLKTGKCVAVLLEAPKIQLSTPVTSPIFQPPPVSGALSLKADSGTIAVSSGVSGESWIYKQAIIAQDPFIQFVCVAKLWTTLQQSPKSDAPQDGERARSPMPRQGCRTPILDLKGRWISYCPAKASSQISLRASIPVPVSGKGPGLSALTPPQLPAVTCELDLPGAESVMNKLMRDATQELISGAKWVGQQGWQAFNTYWKGSAAPQAPRSPPLASQQWNTGYPPRHDTAQFPPTHGAVAPPVSKDPGLISVIDAEALAHSTSIHPLATFPAPLGCSFLSFSPNGTCLFAASSKGDVQSVWDLLRIQHTRSSPLQTSAQPGSPTGPRVRQIAQFSRMTVARIVDVAWTRPHGERLAMVTERGTVHILELPPSAFIWPPPRRRTRTQESKAVTSEGGAGAASIASSALTTAIGAARPLLTRPRRSSSNIPQSTGATFRDQASQGGKMIAAGISHSLGKTGSAISQLRHTGENRAALPSSALTPTPSCVTWITGRRYHSLFVIGDGVVRTFPTGGRGTVSGSGKEGLPRLNRYKDFKLPLLSEDLLAPAVKRFLDPDEYLELNDQNDAGDNTLVLEQRSGTKQLQTLAAAQSSIPQAEIESSAPYQPFHTDRRVALFEYDLNQHTAALQPSDISTMLADTSLEDKTLPARRKQQKRQVVSKPETPPTGAWVFGQPISSTRLDTGHIQISEEESFNISVEDMRALPASAMERVLQHVGDNEEQIVVTTRRRRGGGRAADQDDDGFFEDDCEVLDFADQRV
ncbi:uncharacterized protein E0L32_007165 [Thyridium curvatum]|uniref:Uncharacterized protein n=1 Tax=Thyridium curvatum TaxID=1093900 RepID=A0A507B5Z6_9PEZI|nr:uncharacterized protein E0L32_007165 [Thyridium curvatum]TPX12050.1 hypothetical protein E0L32_007165 [Thyridium curvatum]